MQIDPGFMQTADNDTTAPELAFPSDRGGISSLQFDHDIVLHFTEIVVPGSGSVILSNDTDTHVIDISDASQVSIGYSKFGRGSAVFIDPAIDLIPNTTYSLQISAGAILDTAGNAFEGINDPDIFTISTIPSTPHLAFYSPSISYSSDGIPALKADSNIVLFFDEAMMAGRGKIIFSNGLDLFEINANDASQITFGSDINYNTVIINPGIDLIPGTTYTVQMTDGAVTDLAGNAYSGFSDNEALSFTTTPSNPLLTGSNIIAGGFEVTEILFKAGKNIELYFDEEVMAGDGVVVISNGTDTRTIDVKDTSQVTFIKDSHQATSFVSGKMVINPAQDLLPDTSYTFQMASGVVIDTTGHAYAGFDNPQTDTFNTISANPLLTGSYFANEPTQFQVDSDFQLYFDETVIPGAGSIIISNGVDTRIIDIHNTSQIIFDNDSIYINPSENLQPNTDYSVQIASGVISDIEGRPFEGIHGSQMLNFRTIPTNPVLSPLNTGDVKADNDIELFFNEDVLPGNGIIVISNGADTREININDASQVFFNDFGNVVINPADDLISGTTYHIQMANGVITDTVGNPFNGIDSPDAFNFTTIPAGPLLTTSGNPVDGAVFKVDNDIELFFDEDIMPGNGSIVISDGVDTRIIDIHDTSQVAVSGSKVTVNPANDLIPNTNYNIQITSDAITDTMGNPYAGINDSDTLNFSTINANPLLIQSNPPDDATGILTDSDIALFFDEGVIAGSGAIVISSEADTHIIDIHDASQIFINYNSVFINPLNDLLPDTHYSIQIAYGVITDTRGHIYDGIHDTTTLNFMTADASNVPPIDMVPPTGDVTFF